MFFILQLLQMFLVNDEMYEIDPTEASNLIRCFPDIVSLVNIELRNSSVNEAIGNSFHQAEQLSL